FDSDTGRSFRREILRPFLDQYLKDDAPKADIATVMAFETGTNKWRRVPAWPAGCGSGCTTKGAPPFLRTGRRVPAWPAGCGSGCTTKATPLYLGTGGRVGFGAPKSGEAEFTEYVSDPAKPVPYIRRRVLPASYDGGAAWRPWLVTDQRDASSRPDVATFVSDVLTAPVQISGEPGANLVASTSGTEPDWVVKLIDVWPPEVAGQPEMGGYELAVSMDVFRGRYRESLDKPKALEPDKPPVFSF